MGCPALALTWCNEHLFSELDPGLQYCLDLLTLMTLCHFPTIFFFNGFLGSLPIPHPATFVTVTNLERARSWLMTFLLAPILWSASLRLVSLLLSLLNKQTSTACKTMALQLLCFVSCRLHPLCYLGSSSVSSD